MNRYYIYNVHGVVRATLEPINVLSLASIDDLTDNIDNAIVIVKEGEFISIDNGYTKLLTIDEVVNDKSIGKKKVVSDVVNKVVSPKDASKAMQDYLDQQGDSDKVEIAWDDVAGIVNGKIAVGAKTRKDKYWQLQGWKCVQGGNVLVFDRELLV